MSNPNQSPSSTLAEEPRSQPLGKLFWLVAGSALFFSLVFGVVGAFVVSAFEMEPYDPHDELPWAVDLLFATRYLWWLAFVAASGLTAYALRPSARQYQLPLMLMLSAIGVGCMVLTLYVFGPEIVSGITGQ